MTLNPALQPYPASAGEHDAERRQMLLITAGVAGVAAVATAVPFVASFAPSERARAMGASVEADITDIAPGGIKTVEWRGKPVWIMRRTPDMLAGLPSLDSELADPASTQNQQPDYATNAHRSIKPDVFVSVGICTHLGCSPTAVLRAATTRAWAATGRVDFSALATGPPLIWRDGCSRTSRPPPIWRCRATSTCPTASC